MKSFVDKIKAGFSRFLQGRNGADTLGTNLFISAMVLILADSILQTGILGTIAIVIYVWALFRMLSRNVEKRRAENDRFVSMRNKSRTGSRQFFVRLNNQLYHQILQQYRSSTHTYESNARNYNSGSFDPSKICLGICAANMLCNCCFCR